MEAKDSEACVAGLVVCMSGVCVCVCVWMASSQLLTVLYIVPRWQELCPQCFHLVAPFILHLYEKEIEPIPTQTLNSWPQNKDAVSTNSSPEEKTNEMTP